MDKIKIYGNRYAPTKVKIKINKNKLFLSIIILLAVAEVALGVLWLLGY